jgi:hypothetical protein
VNFYCYLSTIEGTPLPVGTVIDAYDEDSVRCGTFVVETEGQYGLMPVYRDDPNTPDIDEGADPDDTLTFRVNNLPTTPDVTPIWTQLGDNQQVCLEAGLFRIDIITLQPDWNLISWKVNSENDTLSFLFSDILGCLDVALGFEKVGLTFDPDLPEFSTLKTGDHLHGYWLRMECPDTLAVQGAQIAVDTPIPMNVGWNLISYLKTDTDSLTHAFADILDKVQVVLGFNGEAKSWYPELADISTLQLLETGHGYWVWLVAPDTLHYPLTSVYPGGVVRDDAGSKFASTRVTATPEWVNIYSRQLTLDGYAVADNSEIVAVDGSDRIVGAGVVQNGVLKITPVYRDDPRTPFSDGVVAGETFRLVVGGVYTNESFTWSDAGDVIPVDHLTTAEKQPNGLPAQYALYPTYPNPFNPSTTIAFDLPEGGHTQIAIYNILGEKVAVLVDRFLEAGAHEVIWNGTDATGRMQASGIYLVRMKSGSFTQARKMTLLK